MSDFTFNISLSVLNHLGRNLYRSFITVLGEAISNAWDAEADNVRIYLDRDEATLVITDDGNGMTEYDFQNKFLKIGYSKRKDGSTRTENKDRPYIGRKGIGKLALLSCADRVSILTSTESTYFVGGTIDNSGLDQAIEDDLIPQEYSLEQANTDHLKAFTDDLSSGGTVIYFENIKDGIKNTETYLKKVIALYFRFSLLDENFKIYLNDELIDINHLDDLADSTQFLWKINQSSDPFVTQKLLPNQHLKNSKTVSAGKITTGFLASVQKPRNLKILTTTDKVGVDLFVNGRLREKDILKHIPSARIVESYLYGQIHCDFLDDEVDRFTSSREGLVSDDKLFQEILGDLKTLMTTVIEDWDRWRIELNQDGDSENTRMPKKERKSRELYNTVASDYIPPQDSSNHDLVENWIKDLANDAHFNFSSYAECFISENLIRNYIDEKNYPLSPEANREIDKWKRVESDSKEKANMSIDIREGVTNLSYLSMDDLAFLVDNNDPSQRLKTSNLTRDANEYKPVRDAIAHTSRLTQLAKLRLTSTYENIKARLRTLLSE